MKVYFGSDHAGFELKKRLLQLVVDMGHTVEDLGAFEYVEGDDYPDYIKLVAKKVSESPDDTCGIVLGGSGNGEAMVANRFPHVRCALYYGGDSEIVKLAREHNNANMLSLGARFLSIDEAMYALKMWFEYTFSNDERHVRRISKF